MKGQFEKYVNTIRKTAWYYSKLWNIDYEEIESQGYLIYCKALENFDASKNCKFNTHLTYQLKQLNDFCISYSKQIGMLIDDQNDENFKESFSNSLICEKQNWSLKDILYNASDVLSNQAYKLLEWILNRSWENNTTRCKPSVRMMTEAFNCKRSIIEKSLSEIKLFYESPMFNS